MTETTMHMANGIRINRMLNFTLLHSPSCPFQHQSQQYSKLCKSYDLLLSLGVCTSTVRNDRMESTNILLMQGGRILARLHHE